MIQIPTEDGVYLFVGRLSPQQCGTKPSTGATSLNLWIMKDGRYWSPVMLEKHRLVGMFIRLDDAQIQAALDKVELICAQAYAGYLDSQDWYAARELARQIEPASYAELVSSLQQRR